MAGILSLKKGVCYLKMEGINWDTPVRGNERLSVALVPEGRTVRVIRLKAGETLEATNSSVIGVFVEGVGMAGLRTRVETVGLTVNDVVVTTSVGGRKASWRPAGESRVTEMPQVGNWMEVFLNSGKYGTPAVRAVVTNVLDSAVVGMDQPKFKPVVTFARKVRM